MLAKSREKSDRFRVECCEKFSSAQRGLKAVMCLFRSVTPDFSFRSKKTKPGNRRQIQKMTDFT